MLQKERFTDKKQITTGKKYTNDEKRKADYLPQKLDALI